MKKYIILIIFILLFISDEMIPNPNFYHNIKNISEISYTTLINKNNKLSSNFIPVLRKLDTKYAYDEKYMENVAAEQFEKMAKDALELGYKIVAVSAYRSYYYQDSLYKNYVKEKGLEYADKCSARPGHSEHQTGLAVDIMGSNNDYNLFASSKEFNWVKENAHKYGFILRYPEGKEYITGFKYEPWHYRYVGDIASYIYENNITLEEYFTFHKNSSTKINNH